MKYIFYAFSAQGPVWEPVLRGEGLQDVPADPSHGRRLRSLRSVAASMLSF